MIGGKAPFHLPGTGRNCQGSAAGRMTQSLYWSTEMSH